MASPESVAPIATAFAAVGWRSALTFAAAVLAWLCVQWHAASKTPTCQLTPRAPLQHADCHEIFLSSQAEQCVDAGESISLGNSILNIRALATDAECNLLLKEAEAAVEVRSQVRAGAGVFSCRQPRFRMPVINFLFGGSAGRALCDDLLQRALVRISESLPGLVAQRLGEEASESCLSSGIIGNAGLQFSEGEPAINVYYPGGEFAPHEDKQRLTVLLALSDSASGAFAGGGTAFWSEQARAGAKNGSSPPCLTVQAPAGSALIFCGEVTHGALAVASGQRAVYVASFGPLGHDHRHVSRIPMGERVVAAARRRVARAFART